MTSQLSLLYATFPDEDEAIKVIKELLEKRLIACANILGPIKSFYIWEGMPQESEEIAVLLKTTSERISELIKVIPTLHSYATPAILEIPVGKGSDAFAEWISQQVMVI